MRLRSNGEAKARVTNGGAASRSEARRKVGDVLVGRRVVTEDQLNQALAHQTQSGKRLGSLLVELNLLDVRQLAEALAEQFGLPFVDLADFKPDREAIAAVPQSVARQFEAMPLRVKDGCVEVAVADPRIETEELLQQAIGRPVRLMVAPPPQVRYAIDTSYRALDSIDVLVQAFEAAGVQSAVDSSTVGAPEDDAPVVRMVNLILTQAVRDRTSDVHIEPQDKHVRIRFRIDGLLQEALLLPASVGPSLVSRLKIMAGMNIVERRRSQDGQIATNVDGRALDIRVATTSTIWGEKCVLRLLDKSRQLFRLSDLGMPEDTHKSFSHLLRSPFGMVICAGPTGSGKTTTLYSSLMEINDVHRNIMTIEDPVEYVFPSINQIQTNEQAGLSFASGLKSILRQDPDTILVGEIRDPETARIAVQSALTGHLVLSSLHATDATSALHRLLDMGIESFLISSSVLALVGQRLVRRICGYCKVRYELSVEELEFFKEVTGGERKAAFYMGKGCNLCSGSGYQERIGVYEVLRVTPEIRRLIVGWATQEELRRLAISQGMRTLAQEAIGLVSRDVTTVSEVIRHVYMA